MKKHVMGLLSIMLLLLGAAVILPATAQKEERVYEATLSAIGFICVDSHKIEINGFVIIGNNDGKSIFVSQINIIYTGTSIKVVNPAPLLFIISYDPA